MAIIIQYFETALGELILGDYEGQLCLCDWRYRKMRNVIDERIQEGLDAEYEIGETSLIIEAKKQLNDYFLKKRTSFELPLILVGTPFQRSVWDELVKIPYGKTETYLGLSKRMKNERAIRAIAAANGANAISIVVPCHRIIGSNGELIGYAGGINAKKKLLNIENSSRFVEQLKLFT
ncbi:MAG: methylated-DNA--[protein]-cysteine S-methyltransferase [Bacteroidales bacterium]